MTLDDDVLAGKEVRLFPSHHITSEREAELRATAAFLAVSRAVSEFGRAVVSMAGGPRGKLLCYAEVPFKVETETTPREERPDGILKAVRGKTDWTALLEVKVGDNSIEQDQFDRYHALARDRGISALITISSQAALANGLPPQVSVKGWRLKSVPVVHLSWERLLSEAQLLSHRKEVADPDQQWMLEEWIRYVADPQSRIIQPPQLGEHWNQVLRAAREGHLGNFKNQVRDVVQRWDGFLKKVAFRLRARLGVDVQRKASRAERNDPTVRIRNLHTTVINDGELRGTFRIPDAAGDLRVVVLLAARSVRYAIEVDAPREGRAKTRINWLLRQLASEDVPGDMLVTAHWDQRKLSSQARVRDLKENSDLLLQDSYGHMLPKEASPRLFSLDWTIALPKGKGRSTAPVLEGIAQTVEEFYKRVVEGLRPFVPRAPQLPQTDPTSEDRPEDGEAKNRQE